MSMKITVPWQIRLPVMKSRSPRSRNWWYRAHCKEPQSVPLRSVTMKNDDLDHLGALHQVSEHQTKRRWFGK